MAEVSPLSKGMQSHFYGPQSPASKLPTRVPKEGLPVVAEPCGQPARGSLDIEPRQNLHTEALGSAANLAFKSTECVSVWCREAGSVPGAAPFRWELSNRPGVRRLGVTVALHALHQPSAPSKLPYNRNGGLGESLCQTRPPVLAPAPRLCPWGARAEIPGPLPYLGIRRTG